MSHLFVIFFRLTLQANDTSHFRVLQMRPNCTSSYPVNCGDTQVGVYSKRDGYSPDPLSPLRFIGGSTANPPNFKFDSCPSILLNRSADGDCIPCETGYYNPPGDEAETCIVCEDGTELSGTVCRPCSEGYYFGKEYGIPKCYPKESNGMDPGQIAGIVVGTFGAVRIIYLFEHWACSNRCWIQVILVVLCSKGAMVVRTKKLHEESQRKLEDEKIFMWVYFGVFAMMSHFTILQVHLYSMSSVTPWTECPAILSLQLILSPTLQPLPTYDWPDNKKFSQTVASHLSSTHLVSLLYSQWVVTV